MLCDANLFLHFELHASQFRVLLLSETFQLVLVIGLQLLAPFLQNLIQLQQQKKQHQLLYFLCSPIFVFSFLFNRSSMPVFRKQIAL